MVQGKARSQVAKAAKATPEIEHWTSAKVCALLHKYYGGGVRNAIMFEVKDETGYGASRSIDAVTMSLWPSLGLELTGMEIKISRSDWLRELKNPAKASKVFDYFDRWYLVAPKHVAKIDEIPAPWGWLAPEGDKLITMKKSPVNRARPVDRKFLASLLRANNSEALLDAAAARAAEDARKKVVEDYDRRMENEVTRRIKNVEVEAQKYRNICKALGDEMRWMDDGSVIEAVKFVMGIGVLGTYGGARSLQQSLERAAKRIDTELNKLNIKKENDDD